MRVYISGAITGVEDAAANFKKCEEWLKGEGYEVINPCGVLDRIADVLSYEELMSVCFVLMDKCSAVFMIPGWKNSLGANREYGYALGKNLKIYDGEQMAD